jgi:hypothetical protein
VDCIVDAKAIKNTNQGVLFGTGSGNTFKGESSFNGTTGVSFAAANNNVDGALLQANTTLDVSCSASGSVVWNATIKPIAAACECFSGDVHFFGGRTEDTATVAVVAAHFVVNSANATIRLTGMRCTVATRNAQHFVRCQNATGKIYLDGGCRFVGSGVNDFGAMCDAGVISVNATSMTTGIGIYANGGCIRLGDDVDLAGCTTPINVASGSVNRGTVTMNGASPSVGTIVFADLNAADVVKLFPLTPGGTPNFASLHVTNNVGVGAGLVGANGDTSTYAYKIGP